MSAFAAGPIVPVLQVAILPVILVSGVGLLLLTFTNRFGRVSDRMRSLATEARKGTDEERARLRPQLVALFQRAAYLRAAIAFATVSVLLSAFLVMTLFGAAMLELDATAFIGVLFLGCLFALTAATTAFLFDLQMSLRALRLELGSLALVPGERAARVSAQAEAKDHGTAGLAASRRRVE